jgi:hypothetical protein
MFNQEKIYQMLYEKQWTSLCETLFKASKYSKDSVINLASDPIVLQAIKVFENEFLSDIETLPIEKKSKIYKESFPLLQLENKLFSEKFKSELVESKLNFLDENDSNSLMSYISTYQNHPLAKKLIKKVKSKEPEVFANARQEKVSIKSTSTINGAPKTINLFKSPQERYFFEAMRAAYPTYHPYPNVALSCILDFKKIEDLLTPGEKKFYFKSIIDCVVFDSTKEYKPLFFFELDSSYHDNEKSKINDALKKSIFEKANVKLFSIRHDNANEASKENFEKIIIDLVRN